MLVYYIFPETWVSFQVSVEVCEEVWVSEEVVVMGGTSPTKLL